MYIKETSQVAESEFQLRYVFLQEPVSVASAWLQHAGFSCEHISSNLISYMFCCCLSSQGPTDDTSTKVGSSMYRMRDCVMQKAAQSGTTQSQHGRHLHVDALMFMHDYTCNFLGFRICGLWFYIACRKLLQEHTGDCTYLTIGRDA